MTHLHISVPAITRGTLARTHELKSMQFDNRYFNERVKQRISVTFD